MLKLTKKIFAVCILLVFVAGLAYAAAPDVMTFKAKKGVVTFKHKVHQESPSVKEKGCKTCHHKMEGDKPTKKCRDCHTKKKKDKQPSLKKAMHKLCKDCHKKTKKGPKKKCTECHVKAKK